MTYSSKDILAHDDIQLTQGGLVLIGVLRGGDYSEGLHGCGVATAHGLAKCGFGDTLLRAARTLPREELDGFLVCWREELRVELRKNTRGHLQRKSPALAKAIGEDFPDLDVLLSYTNPVTSEEKGRAHRNANVDWDKEPDLGRIAGLCEMYFEWGLKEIIIKRFRTVLWQSAVQRILRRAAILRDRQGALAGRSAAVDPVTPRKNGKTRRAPPGTPSSMITKHFSTMTLQSPHRAHGGGDEDEEEDEERLIVKIHSSRRHASTDNLLEYRLEIAPAQLVRLCEAGIKGLRTALPPDLSDDEEDNEDDDGGGKKKKTKKPPPDPLSHLRLWLPACMVDMVEPELVEEFEGVEQKKAEKKAAKGAKSGAAGTRKAKKAPAVDIVPEEEEESGSDSMPPLQKPKVTKPATGVPSKKVTGKAAVTAADVESAQINDFFTAKKKTSTAASTKTNRTSSKTSRIADLFKDVLELDRYSEDEQPAVSCNSHLPSLAKPSASSAKRSSASGAPSTSTSGSSRLLSFLDTMPSPSSSPSKRFHASTSPTKQRPLAPFPMDFSEYKLGEDDPADDEDLFATESKGASSSSGVSRTRARSALTTSEDDSEDPRTSLQKSPRRSEKHSSPRNTPSKGKGRALSLRMEEEESSEDDCTRPPSPSPLKGQQQATVLTPKQLNLDAAHYALREEEEESDRAPSPSLSRRKLLSKPTGRPAAASTRPVVAVRKPAAPFPADMSIISISSGSEDDAPPRRPVKNVAPLLAARARMGGKVSVERPPRRHCDPDDVIDLT